MESFGNNHGSAAVVTTAAAQPSFTAGASAATVGDNLMGCPGVNGSQLPTTMAALSCTGGAYVLPPDTPSPQPKLSKARRRSDSPQQDAHPRPCTAESVRGELLAVIAKNAGAAERHHHRRDDVPDRRRQAA